MCCPAHGVEGGNGVEGWVAFSCDAVPVSGLRVTEDRISACYREDMRRYIDYN